MADDSTPLRKLLEIINYEKQQPILDIAQATITDCTLTLETLRRYNRTLISTSTNVALHSLHDNTSWFNISPAHEEAGADWFIGISGPQATATYRLDYPSRPSRLNFQDRFDKRCQRTICEIEYTPKVLTIHLPSSSKAERQALVKTMRASIEYCVSKL